MVPRIENAELISFRLKVPLGQLEDLVNDPEARGLGLTLSTEGTDRLFTIPSGDSFLRFRPIGSDAMLAEAGVARDVEGAFFFRVLGGLLLRHAGDLHARLVWNSPEYNLDGEHLEVRVSRGVPDRPETFRRPSAPTAALATTGNPAEAMRNTLRAAAEDLEPVPVADQQEILELLERGRAYFEEYLRLKAKQKK